VVIRRIVDRLKAAVLGPLTGVLGDVDQVVLVPAGVLSGLPLHVAAALTGIGVSYAPSARILAAARRGAQPAAPILTLTVADPADTGYPPLTGARLEADVVAAVFPGSEPPLTGAAATRAAVKDLVGSSGLIHIASHGCAALSSPLDSGLDGRRET
jgi:CHAT domain-containing protein